MKDSAAKILDGESAMGTFHVANYDLTGACARAHEIDAFLQTAANLPHTIWKQLISELKSLCPVKEKSFKNRIVLSGRTAQIGRLVGDTTYTGIVNYGALGTGSTAISDSDTTLDTEVARKTYASRSQTGDQCSIDFYYSKADTNGTYEEFGTFIDATATVDSGLMFNRALTGGWVKSALEAMTVSIQFTMNAV